VVLPNLVIKKKLINLNETNISRINKLLLTLTLTMADNFQTPIPMTIDDDDNDLQPKKRGRKPKTKELVITTITNNTTEIDGIEITPSAPQTQLDTGTPTDTNPASIAISTDNIDINMADAETADNNDDGSMKTKRRGRKPKDKFKYESTDIDEYQKNNRKEDNVIIKLPLSCLKLNEEFNVGKDLFPYNPNISTPKPFNPEYKGNIGFSLLNDDEQDENDNNYENISGNQIDRPDNCKQYCSKCINCECNKNGQSQNDKQPDARQIDIILNNKYNSNTDKFNVLTHLGASLTGSKWIEKTEVACLWCCHQFKNTPWGIPFKFTNDKFQLFGNFCMPNCALAYILQNYKDDDYLWEKVALLNLLFFKVCGEYKNITPAIDKMALKMFGGTLEIDEYRGIIGENEKSYSIEFPPCNTIIPMLEEIYKKTNLNNTFIPVDKSRIQVANNELKLKRSKPVVNHKNTLDFCLGKVSA
jgi:thiol-disulfide isomerase/thioredoxin